MTGTRNIERSTRYAITTGVLLVGCLLSLVFALTTDSLATTRSVDDKNATRDLQSRLLLALRQFRQQARSAKNQCDAYLPGVASRDIESLVSLANCFKHGVGRPKSLLRAKKLFEEAAHLGSNEAHLSLGQFYLDGRIVVQDLQQSASHFGKAARGGLPAAMIEYGHNILRIDPSQSVVACEWFEQAAEKGERNGIRLLGDCFAREVGERRQRSRSRDYYVRAAQMGDRTAHLKLNDHVFAGYGAEVAAREGCDWASEAAKRGNRSAFAGNAYCLSVARPVKSSRR